MKRNSARNMMSIIFTYWQAEKAEYELLLATHHRMDILIRDYSEDYKDI